QDADKIGDRGIGTVESGGGQVVAGLAGGCLAMSPEDVHDLQLPVCQGPGRRSRQGLVLLDRGGASGATRLASPNEFAEFRWGGGARAGWVRRVGWRSMAGGGKVSTPVWGKLE